MTAPRRLLRGATYLFTRRCLRGKYLLRPGKLPNQLFGYILALAARSSGVRVHAFCFMSNHLHLVVSDPGATLPLFAQELDNLIARSINALYGLHDAVWASGGYNAVALATPEDILDKCAYTLANPVAAGLVPKARKWPGLWSAPEDMGQTLTYERPNHFFRKTSLLPQSLDLALAIPNGFASAEAFRSQLEAAVAERERTAASERTSFLGVARILKQRVLDRPASEPRRTLRPRFAAKSAKVRERLATELKAFLAAYRDALRAWREGNRGVVFPLGTYQLRVEHLAACAGAG